MIGRFSDFFSLIFMPYSDYACMLSLFVIFDTSGFYVNKKHNILFNPLYRVVAAQR